MKHHLRLGSRIAITAGVCALLLGACSAGPAAPSTGGGATPPAVTAAPLGSAPQASTPAAAVTKEALDTCSLLTASEIEAATGYEVVKTDPDPADGLSDCAWTLSGQGGTIGLQVELDSPRAQQDHRFNCTVGFGLAAIEGVGDSACGDPIAGGTYLLYALRGDDQVTLRMQANYQIDKSAWATLAKVVFAKLP